MSKKSKQSSRTTSQSGQNVEATRVEATQDDPRNHPAMQDRVSPTSERIIVKTAVKRRKAMKALADR